MTVPNDVRFRVTDRTLWIIVGVAALALLAAVGFVFWVNGGSPMTPVPVASSPSA